MVTYRHKPGQEHMNEKVLHSRHTVCAAWLTRPLVAMSVLPPSTLGCIHIEADTKDLGAISNLEGDFGSAKKT